MKNKKYLFGLFSLFLFFIVPMITKAGNGSIYLNGNLNYYPGKTFTLDIVANASAGNIMGIGGSVKSSNPSCVEIQSISNVISGSFNNSTKFGYLDTSGDGFSGTSVIVRLNMKSVGQSCTANIQLSELTISFVDGSNLKPSASFKTVNVSAPPSTNNNLTSLSVSAGSLSPSFNANQTSYTVNVNNDVSSINITASLADSKASISGVGQKNLNYGDNNFPIVVTAEDGSKKTYNVNVNRKDNRSNDSTLKSLSVSNGSLSPSFSSGTTSYSMKVPYNVTKLELSAIANDSKANVSIYNPDLVAEKTTIVSITVKAENGSTKTYTINVERGKDPNKVLSTDNKLLSLVPSVGILSPVFDSNKNNYYVYLPYEIDTISFEYEISDKDYAIVEYTGDENLIPDSDNYFVFKVTAEDESVNTYTVTVNRAKNHDGESNEDIIKKLEAAKDEKAKNDTDACNSSKKGNVIIIILVVIILLLVGLSVYLFVMNRMLSNQINDSLNKQSKNVVEKKTSKKKLTSK